MSIKSQSLSSRAMSFDTKYDTWFWIIPSSIPFEQGDVFRHRSGMLEAGIMRPFRPTSQFLGKVKELALDLSK